jgi:phosphocarrier protein HPr
MINLIDATVSVSEIFIVKNDRGIHTRPATEIVKCAASFNSDIYFTYQKLEVNAKSILGILMLTAGRGARIRIKAIGDDAAEAVEALLDLAKNQFNTKY